MLDSLTPTQRGYVALGVGLLAILLIALLVIVATQDDVELDDDDAAPAAPFPRQSSAAPEAAPAETLEAPAPADVE